ncbi:MAG: tRNA lysidine(34) synthetase TilS [Verrucomicrobia bacterium]|nr:tRNA lysidine(34) synthetase TilS [Verrucomicrobiota bacterium]MBS0647477.1 tRNA lysidine(34) synthetase TilS [Verrucomicrobiota bacterium]
MNKESCFTITAMIEHHLRQFLKKFHDGRAFLLALSGGPDSMVLFRLLLQENIPFSVAHVDHGWREESGKEAQQLQELCNECRVPFFLHKLNIQGPNLEDRCRQARYAFFRQCLTPQMQGVVLGHQADDWSETVLKRIFEGARLTKLSGLRPVTQFEEMTLLRPLLHVRKKQILSWLHQHGHWFFEDATNLDPRFLRSRFRLEIHPFLEKKFGKALDSSLVRLAQASLELEHHVNFYLNRYSILTEEDRVSLDFNHCIPQTDFEWRMVVSSFFERQGISISSHSQQQIIEHLQRRSTRKTLRLKNCYVTLHRLVLTLQPVMV